MSMDLNRAIVVKLGGSVFDSKDATIQDVVDLQKAGQLLIVVHGGASLVTQWLKEQGVPSRFHEGERITDEKSLDVVAAVLAGLANKETVAAIITAGGRAVGISGVDGGLIQGRIRDKSLGYIGEVACVDPAPLQALLDAGLMPVVSPVSLHAVARPGGTPLLLNINGDTVAGAVAAAIHAARLIFLTDVGGIQDASGARRATLSPKEALALLNTGVAKGGMIPKLRACLMAVRAGVTCSIVDGRKPHALAKVISGGTGGTVITAEKEA